MWRSVPRVPRGIKSVLVSIGVSINGSCSDQIVARSGHSHQRSCLDEEGIVDGRPSRAQIRLIRTEVAAAAAAAAAAGGTAGTRGTAGGGRAPARA